MTIDLELPNSVAPFLLLHAGDDGARHSDLFETNGADGGNGLNGSNEETERTNHS